MDIVAIELDPVMYPLFIIRAAAYALLDRATTILSITVHGTTLCQLISKPGLTPIQGEALKHAFLDELTTQAHYFSQLEKTKDISGPLIRAALGGS